MGKPNLSGLMAVCLIASLFLGGCVERRLTINTEPQGALVILNDEEIGESPVTVNFNWYGDYWVRIRKEGYETKTICSHRLTLISTDPLFVFLDADGAYPGAPVLINAELGL